MTEEWRTVVVGGKEHPWYSVSNLGNIRTHLKRTSNGLRFFTSCDLSYHKNVSRVKEKVPTNGSLRRLKVNVKFPEDFFEDHQYCKTNNTDSNVSKHCSVHKLVMEAFRPMDEYPPDRLKDCWDDIPEDAKTWIKESVTINHIDHDPSNNHVDNLEYVTPRENSLAALKHYGGLMANKSKQNDNCIKFIEPVFNPLLQEYEDGEIQFIGQEGEKYYNMLEEIAKECGKPPGETFFEIIEKEFNEMECEFK
jgi:hypothetical protein